MQGEFATIDCISRLRGGNFNLPVDWVPWQGGRIFFTNSTTRTSVGRPSRNYQIARLNVPNNWRLTSYMYLVDVIYCKCSSHYCVCKCTKKVRLSLLLIRPLIVQGHTQSPKIDCNLSDVYTRRYTTLDGLRHVNYSRKALRNRGWVNNLFWTY